MRRPAVRRISPKNRTIPRTMSPGVVLRRGPRRLRPRFLPPFALFPLSSSDDFRSVVDTNTTYSCSLGRGLRTHALRRGTTGKGYPARGVWQDFGIVSQHDSQEGPGEHVSGGYPPCTATRPGDAVVTLCAWA